MTIPNIIHRARHGLYLSPADVRLLAERVGELEGLINEAVNGADDCSGWWGGGDRERFMEKLERFRAQAAPPSGQGTAEPAAFPQSCPGCRMPETQCICGKYDLP